jgi:hypothetical protein
MAQEVEAPMQANRNAGGGIAAHTWDARAELALAAFIRRHLHDDPPPDGSVVATDLHELADLLESDGGHRLRALGGTRLESLEARFDRARAAMAGGV